jgi:hypothetical protein
MSNRFLVVVCLLQFVVICFMLYGTHEFTMKPQSVLETLPEQNAVSRSNIALEEQISARVPVLRTYGGVAATVMLHSPKWFQRRYSVMVQNVVNNIPPNWAVQVFYIPNGGSLSGITINPGIKKLLNAGKIILTPMPDSMTKGKRRRSDYFLDPWLWENMLADTVLLFGGNSVICSNSHLTVENFTSFDYIGPPWPDHGGVGGSGEISVRNRNLMLEILHEKMKSSGVTKDFTDKWGLEDHFFVRSLKDLLKSGRSLRVANAADSREFASTDNVINENSFAASGTLAAATDEQRESFFAYCPELKVIFPSLHNPGCFGASPNAEKCEKSICALQKDRKGGC